jgi:hypothetical protein
MGADWLINSACRSPVCIHLAGLDRKCETFTRNTRNHDAFLPHQMRARSVENSCVHQHFGSAPLHPARLKSNCGVLLDARQAMQARCQEAVAYQSTLVRDLEALQSCVERERCATAQAAARAHAAEVRGAAAERRLERNREAGRSVASAVARLQQQLREAGACKWGRGASQLGTFAEPFSVRRIAST